MVRVFEPHTTDDRCVDAGLVSKSDREGVMNTGGQWVWVFFLLGQWSAEPWPNFVVWKWGVHS